MSPRWSARRSVPVALLAVVLVAGWSYLRPGAGHGDGDPQALRAEPSEDQQQATAAADNPSRVLIFGDSIADQHGSHAAFALEEAGVETELMTLWGQGLFTRDQYDMGATNPDPPDGSMLAAASQVVVEFDPDVVAVYSNHNFWPPYPRDGEGREIRQGTPAFAAMVRSQLAELTRRLTAGGAAVYLVEPVPEGPGETVEDNEIWAGYLAARQELGLGVIEAGDTLASTSGTRVESLLDCTGRDEEVRPHGGLHLTYYGSGVMGTHTARSLAGILGLPPRGIRAPADAPAAMVPLGSGYRLVTCDGGTFAFGPGTGASGPSDLGAERPAGDPVVAATEVPGGGVWAVTAGGRVLAGGGAPRLDDRPRLADGDRAVGIAPTTTGEGYWVATRSGRVEAVGDAPAQGDVAGTGEEVVAIAGTPDHEGYWLVRESGRVAAFGTAGSFGDLRADPPAAGVVDIAPHPGGGGYWILDRAGGVHGFGDARHLGSVEDQPMMRLGEWRAIEDYDTHPVAATEAPTHPVALLPTVSGDGYWVWLGNGAVCRFGDADQHGGIHRAEINQVMLFLGLPYYGEGPCDQDVGFRSLSEAQIDASQDAGDAPLHHDVG